MVTYQISWKMRAFVKLLLVAVAAGAWLRADETTYQISDAERLQLSQLESSIWRARYAAAAAQNDLNQALGRLRQSCESSGGAFSADPSQPASCTCSPSARDEAQRSPDSATEPNQTKVPEAQ